MGEHEVLEQHSWRPVAKVAASWWAGGGATAVVAALAALSDQVDASTAWGAAVAWVVAGAVAYLKRSRVSDQ